MQVCRVHHQRQANHIHTSTYKKWRVTGCIADDEPIRAFANMLSCLFPETHAILQETDGLGDPEQETVVKLGLFFLLT